MLRGSAIKIQSLFMLAHRLTASTRVCVLRISVPSVPRINVTCVSPANINLQQSTFNVKCIFSQKGRISDIGYLEDLDLYSIEMKFVVSDTDSIKINIKIEV